MSVIKQLMVGILLLSAVAFGSLSFVADGFGVYNVSHNSTFLNGTMGYIENMSAQSQAQQAQLTSEGAFDFGVLSLLGFAFKNFAIFITNMFGIVGLLTTIVGDFQASAASFLGIDPMFFTIILSIIGVVVVIAGIAFAVGKRGDDI